MTDKEILTNIYKNGFRNKQDVMRAVKMGWKTTGFWYEEEIKAIYAFFIDEDINSARQHFFSCGVIDEFEIDYLDQPILSYGLNHLGYALLSDNTNLIQRYAKLDYTRYEKDIKSGGAAPAFILQCLIRDDMQEFERGIAIMKDKTLKKLPMQLDLDFYLALAERNEGKIEEALSKFVSPKIHIQRNKYHLLTNRFISHPALGYAKLAWMKGVKIETNNPLIPQSLLPISPLDEYLNEYAFLKEMI